MLEAHWHVNSNTWPAWRLKTGRSSCRRFIYERFQHSDKKQVTYDYHKL